MSGRKKVDPATPETTGDRILGAAMALALAIGFGLAIAAIGTPGARRRLDGTLDVASMVAGRTAAAINYVTAHYLPIDEALRATGGVLRWRLFGSGGPQVWVGRDGWLFLTEELRPFKDAEAAMRSRIAILRHVQDQLTARKIGLLVILVPDKARVMRAEMHGPRSEQAEARYPELLRLLADAHVPAVNLFDVFASARNMVDKGGGALFYRTDTHWNQAGAALAARATAAAIKVPIDRGQKFDTETEPAETEWAGDLLRLMSLEKVPDGLPIRLRPPADRQHVERTVALAGTQPAGGLLDDGPSIEVALLGSSYSVNANFAGRLAEAIGAPIGNFAQAGGGFAAAARAYFSGATFRESPPKLVIWEIPERVMGQPIGPDDLGLQGLTMSVDEAAKPR